MDFLGARSSAAGFPAAGGLAAGGLAVGSWPGLKQSQAVCRNIE